MLRKMSVYKCSICGRELEALPGISIYCSNCNVRMEEVETKRGSIQGLVSEGKKAKKVIKGGKRKA